VQSALSLYKIIIMWDVLVRNGVEDSLNRISERYWGGGRGCVEHTRGGDYQWYQSMHNMHFEHHGPRCPPRPHAPPYYATPLHVPPHPAMPLHVPACPFMHAF